MMHTNALALLALTGLALINVIVTVVVLRKPSLASGRKALYIVGVWILPLVGALLVSLGLGPPPVGTSEPPNDSKIPW
jgi:hypothetical protein